jgi:hypothetical protein
MTYFRNPIFVKEASWLFDWIREIAQFSSVYGRMYHAIELFNMISAKIVAILKIVTLPLSSKRAWASHVGGLGKPVIRIDPYALSKTLPKTGQQKLPKCEMSTVVPFSLLSLQIRLQPIVVPSRSEYSVSVLH